MERLRAALEQKSAEWRSDLRREPAVARMVLRRLVGPLTIWEDDRPDFVQYEGPTTPENLLEGLANHLVSSPTGFEPVFWP